MREISTYTFVTSILIVTLLCVYAVVKINKHCKINLTSDKDFRNTQECENLVNENEYRIKSIFKVIKLFYFVFVLTMIDTLFIYESSLLKAFSNNQKLICIYKGDNIEVSKSKYQYSNKNTLLPSGQIFNDNGIIIDLDMCKIKNKKWWE